MAVPIGFIAQRDDAAFVHSYGLLVKIGSPIPMQDWSGLTVAIAQYEMSYQVAQNLDLADNVMNASWRSYPRGTDAAIDALRQRLQNIIDLQRAIDNAYLSVGLGTDSCMGGGQACRRQRNLAISGQLRAADAAALRSEARATDVENLPVADAHDVSHYGSTVAAKYQLDLQEVAFEKELHAASITCGI
jgi:hypothetical protein